MPDPRTAPLREAMHRNPEWPCSCVGLYDENRHTVAILAALPPDFFCEHPEHDEIARLRAIEEAARAACDNAYRDRADPETMDALRAALATKDATDG